MAGCSNSTMQLKLNEFFKRQKEEHNEKNIEFTWPDFCKHIPKCVLYRASQLRQIAWKGLGQCSYKVVDQFLMFALELLISEDTLTNETFTALKQRAENLTFEDAETMLQVIVIIREKFNENTIRPLEYIRFPSDVVIPDNLFNFKFELKPVTMRNTETHIVPWENTDQGNSSLQRRNEEMKPLTVKFVCDVATYEEKLNEYYEKSTPIISRQAVKDTIIEILHGQNIESDLIDFLGCDAIEFIQYIVENQKGIAALDPDFERRKDCSVVIEELVNLLTQEEEDEEEVWKNMKRLGTTLMKQQTKKK